MSVKVIVMLNDTEIASATISNISDLNSISDYSVTISERGDDRLNIPSFTCATTQIEKHPRNQTVWALIKKVADFAIGHSHALR